MLKFKIVPILEKNSIIHGVRAMMKICVLVLVLALHDMKQILLFAVTMDVSMAISTNLDPF